MIKRYFVAVNMIVNSKSEEDAVHYVADALDRLRTIDITFAICEIPVTTNSLESVRDSLKTMETKH